MASSAYYTNGESSYWPYHQTLPESSVYPNPSYFQHPQPHFQHHQPVLQPQQQTQTFAQQSNSPPYCVRVKQEPNATPSLLETLLRHGKEAVAETYTNCVPKAEPGLPAQLSTYAQCQSPAYASSSSSERTSPTPTSFGDALPQKCMAQQMQSSLSYEQTYAGYAGPQAAEYAPVPAPVLPTGFEPVHAGYNAAGAYANNNNNNNNIKSCLQEGSEFRDEQSQRQVDFPWMKTNCNNGAADVNSSGQKRTRQTYTRFQTLELEKEFHFHRYLTRKRRIEISQALSLSERQIKIWFQNRRMKAKKDGKLDYSPSEQTGNDLEDLPAEAHLEPALLTKSTTITTSTTMMLPRNVDLAQQHHHHQMPSGVQLDQHCQLQQQMHAAYMSYPHPHAQQHPQLQPGYPELGDYHQQQQQQQQQRAYMQQANKLGLMGS